MPNAPRRPSAAASQPAATRSFREALLPFAPLLALFVIAVGYFALLRPRFATLRDLRARRAIEREVVDLEHQAAQLASARKTFEETFAAKREIIDAAVPGGEDVPGLFVAIDAAAQNAGLVITSMEVTREEPPAFLRALGGKSALVIGASLRGVDYPRLKSFLNVLTASRRILDVLSVQFSPQALNATVRVRAYSLD